MSIIDKIKLKYCAKLYYDNDNVCYLWMPQDVFNNISEYVITCSSADDSISFTSDIYKKEVKCDKKYHNLLLRMFVGSVLSSRNFSRDLLKVTRNDKEVEEVEWCKSPESDELVNFIKGASEEEKINIINEYSFLKEVVF